MQYHGYTIKTNQGVFQDETIITTLDGFVVAQALDVESAQIMIDEFLPKAAK